jgi:parallel beta-helix repeat protein
VVKNHNRCPFLKKGVEMKRYTTTIISLRRAILVAGSLSTAVIVLLALLGLLNSLALAQASAEVIRVATTGNDTVDCGSVAAPCRTVQYAVDVAQPGDEIRVATGTYTGVQARAGVTQVVYISKTVAVRGGYTTTDWDTSDPAANPTTLNAQRQGRVLYITGDIRPTIEGLHITEGDASTGSSEWSSGGGVYVSVATVTISNSTVFSNTADDGAGLFLENSDATLVSNTIASNVAKESGGGVLLKSGHNTTLSNNVITSNRGGDYGGGAYVSASDNVILEENIITSNHASGWGGGVYLGQYMGHSDNAVISGNTLDSNTASSGGGAFLYYSDHATISGNSFTSNIVSTSGGGLYLDHSENITVSQNSVTGNTAGWVGGGMDLSGSTAVLDGNRVISNTAIGDYGGGIPIGVGGGIAISFSQAELINTLIADNQVNSAGSGLSVSESFVQVMHATIARNSGGDGSGIHITGDEFMGYSDVVLTNTILVSHTIGVTVREGNTATLEATVWGSGVWANDTDWDGVGTIYTGTINIWQDPVFVNSAAWNYHLGPGSAAIDAGVDAGVTIDIDGESRPWPSDGDYDIGADESGPWHAIYLPLTLRSFES